MTTEQHNELLTELRAIRGALETKSRPVATTPSAPAAQTGTAPIPLPINPVFDAHNVAVHFGKNAGIPLGSLSAKSIEWYAADKLPQLKNDGTPFAPRPADLALQQAARTIHHGLAIKPAPAAVSDAPVGDDGLPF